MDIVVRAIFAFIFVVAITRVIGRRELSSLRRERLTPEEIAAEARLQQIPSLREVRWAVLETSGKISFIPRNRG
jgi:uncharacterized membrane protein YcaP (DUF421 family)